MKRTLKFLALGLLASGLGGNAIVSRGQNREKFVISAKAGGVNSVLGRVTVQSRGNMQFNLLTAQADLGTGDVVDTGASGRAEILLNPGSYLRVSSGTRFELVDNSLDRLTLKLLQGTAIVEATGANDVNTEITVQTPQSRLALVKRGIYRFNVSGSQSEVLVLKGKAIVNGDELRPIRGGQKAVLNAGTVVATKLDKKEQDDFDSWSRARAETLARANSRLPARALNSYLSSLDTEWPLVSYSGGNGVWLYHSSSMCFTFVPFYPGWGSPYGPSYASLFYWSGDPWGRYGYNRYPVIVTNPPPNVIGGSGGSGNSGSSGGGIGPSVGPSGGSNFPSRPSIGAGDGLDRVGPRGKNIEPSDPNRPH
ncbi:MAG: hypothetical protein QOD75_266 [Blastocatellia bacterium]|jgi:hypothetical protein|nr:hypothetical protein [Blastocatellia bacterium]